MSDHPVIRSLQQRYRSMLRTLAEGKAFEPFDVRGFGRMPDTTTELHRQIRFLQDHEKMDGKRGWIITWGQHSSRRVGMQQWPERIIIDTPEDLAELTGNGHAYTKFARWIEELLRWRSELRSFLVMHPEKVTEHATEWPLIMLVIDQLLTLNTPGGFIRSMAVPVHTKWLKSHEPLLVGILKAVDPLRFPEGVSDLETAFTLSRKPFLFPIRWLDPDACQTEAGGQPLMALPVEGIRMLNWTIDEIWLVENETNLYLLPPRDRAIAMFASGKAVALLKDLELLRRCRLIYWGDLDEHGFRILAYFRNMYPHTISFCMDMDTVSAHQSELVEQPQRYKPDVPQGLTSPETAAFEKLRACNGRIEQERIRLDHLSEQIDRC